jgi:predicted GNAT family N-acyltransferase
MNNLIYFTEIEFGTPAYDQSIQLRDEVLRKPLGLEFSIDELSKEYSSHHIACFAMDSEDMLGILVLKPLNSQDVKMRQVAICTHLQSKGIGSLLVKYSEEYAISKGYLNIELNARESAVAFYKKLGYTVEGGVFEEVSIPHFRMVKKIKD